MLQFAPPPTHPSHSNPAGPSLWHGGGMAQVPWPTRKTVCDQRMHRPTSEKCDRVPGRMPLVSCCNGSHKLAMSSVDGIAAAQSLCFLDFKAAEKWFN